VLLVKLALQRFKGTFLALLTSERCTGWTPSHSKALLTPTFSCPANTAVCDIHKFVQCLINCLFHLTFSAISFFLTSFSSWIKFPTQLLLRIITLTYFHLQVDGWPCVNFFQRIRIKAGKFQSTMQETKHTILP
jgi:hypothetical protein